MSDPDELEESLVSQIYIAFGEFRRDNPDLGDRIANEMLHRACLVVGSNAECRIDDIDGEEYDEVD